MIDGSWVMFLPFLASLAIFPLGERCDIPRPPPFLSPPLLLLCSPAALSALSLRYAWIGSALPV